jgi:hypothetical protein
MLADVRFVIVVTFPDMKFKGQRELADSAQLNIGSHGGVKRSKITANWIRTDQFFT